MFDTLNPCLGTGVRARDEFVVLVSFGAKGTGWTSLGLKDPDFAAAGFAVPAGAAAGALAVEDAVPRTDAVSDALPAETAVCRIEASISDSISRLCDPGGCGLHTIPRSGV